MSDLTRNFYLFGVFVFVALLVSSLLNPIPNRHFKYSPQTLHKGVNTVKLTSKKGYLICCTAFFDFSTYMSAPSAAKLKAVLEEKRLAFTKLSLNAKLPANSNIQLLKVARQPIQRLNCSIATYGPALWSETEQEQELILDWRDTERDLPDLQVYLVELGDSPDELRERIVCCSAKEIPAGARLLSSDITYGDFIYKNIGPSFPTLVFTTPEGVVLRNSVAKGHKFDPHDFVFPSSKDEFQIFLNQTK